MPSRHRPSENSASGLSLLGGTHRVVVTQEEHHQAVLSSYAPRGDGKPRRVVVELVLAHPTRGGRAGQRGIEVRLDGQRVGELTPRMAQRYGPMIEDVVGRGARPGCAASVVVGRRGHEVELRLPEVAERLGAPPARVLPGGSPPAGARPSGARPPAGPGVPARGNRRRRWIGAGAGTVVALLIISVSVGGGETVAPVPPSVAAVSGPVAPTTSTAPPSTTTSAPATSTTSAAPVGAAATVASPITRKPTTTTVRAAPEPPPVPEPTTTKKAKAAAESAGGCDPNYGGCVPVASDVDCAGGSGNGPEYATGPISVTGSDVYDLDRDNDGIACEA